MDNVKGEDPIRMVNRTFVDLLSLGYRANEVVEMLSRNVENKAFAELSNLGAFRS